MVWQLLGESLAAEARPARKGEENKKMLEVKGGLDLAWRG
jgi:hypothetical protein